jgi:sterol desaturase/sphingolipid hydroxylase (fatty acid hydroxylase superfamily)
MSAYSEIFFTAFGNYADYIWNQITFQASPWYENYFWWLILVSAGVWGLEVAFPWRKNQGIIRKDFWLDAFFMFFNFYIFNLIIFIAFSKVLGEFLTSTAGGSISNWALFDLSALPSWLQLLLFFVVLDFAQWLVHRTLHRIPFLWNFHKVHHSVQEMGFAAHLRYHWMETLCYNPIKYIAVMLIGGFATEQAFIVYFATIVIGHLNHANIGWDYGPLKYIFNNPKMHIWHHAKELPAQHKFGANFAISLSLWDYLFKTSHVPSSGRDIALGFEDIEQYPKSFWQLISSGFRKK